MKTLIAEALKMNISLRKIKMFAFLLACCLCVSFSPAYCESNQQEDMPLIAKKEMSLSALRSEINSALLKIKANEFILVSNAKKRIAMGAMESTPKVMEDEKFLRDRSNEYEAENNRMYAHVAVLMEIYRGLGGNTEDLVDMFYEPDGWKKN